MKTSQIAFMVAFAGILIAPSLSQARVSTIENYISNWNPHGFTKTRHQDDAACSDVCQSAGKTNINPGNCHQYTTSTEARPGMSKSCTCYSDGGNQPNGYSIDDKKVISLDPLYTANECKAVPLNPKKICINGKEETRYGSCGCNSPSMTEETYNYIKNIDFISGDLGVSGKYYTDKSSGVRKYCFKNTPKCKEYPVPAAGGFSTLADGNKILNNAFNTLLKNSSMTGAASLTKKGGYYDFTLNITRMPISDAGLFPKPFNGHALTFYNSNNALVGLYCMDYWDIGKSDEDYKNVFGNPAKVDMLSRKKADNNYINETNAQIAEGNMKLPWIKTDDKLVDVQYGYFSKCRSNGRYETFSTTGSVSCGSGISSECKTNKGKFNRYDGGKWEQGYCCECGSCTNSYNTSTGVLYAASGVSDYSPTTPAAFTKTDCEIKCNTGYTKVCIGGSTACSDAIYTANGKNKTEIAAVSGSITSGLAAQYTYNIATLVVKNGSTVYGRIACATPVGCNIAGGYVNNTCSIDSWVTWFNN